MVFEYREKEKVNIKSKGSGGEGRTNGYNGTQTEKNENIPTAPPLK